MQQFWRFLFQRNLNFFLENSTGPIPVQHPVCAANLQLENAHVMERYISTYPSALSAPLSEEELSRERREEASGTLPTALMMLCMHRCPGGMSAQSSINFRALKKPRHNGSTRGAPICSKALEFHVYFQLSGLCLGDCQQLSGKRGNTSAGKSSASPTTP